MDKVFEIGETVLYKDHEVVIEEIVNDKYVIDNPFWENDDDDPFWLHVEGYELTKVN